jgi:hypothetical protein
MTRLGGTSAIIDCVGNSGQVDMSCSRCESICLSSLFLKVSGNSSWVTGLGSIWHYSGFSDTFSSFFLKKIYIIAQLQEKYRKQIKQKNI